MKERKTKKKERKWNLKGEKYNEDAEYSKILFWFGFGFWFRLKFFSKYSRLGP